MKSTKDQLATALPSDGLVPLEAIRQALTGCRIFR
jgi:hypothetical protein